MEVTNLLSPSLTGPAPLPSLVESAGHEDPFNGAENGATKAGASPIYLEAKLAEKLLGRAGVPHSISATEGSDNSSDGSVDCGAMPLKSEASIA